MEGKTLAQMGAVAFVAIAMTATVLKVTRVEDAPVTSSLRPAVPATHDLLRAELIRCQGVGEAGTRDATCLAAWAESRRRFLTPGTSQAKPANATVVPKNSTEPVLEETAPATTPVPNGSN